MKNKMKFTQHFYGILLFLFVQSGTICHGDDNPLVFSTNNCLLTEPVYNHTFDFTGLHSDFGHQTFGPSGDQFDFNICGNLSKKCDGQTNVAACLKQNNKEYILGTQHHLNYSNGKIFFEFSDGSKCTNGSGKFSFHVVLHCDYTLDKNPIRVTTYAKDACSFYVDYETPLACLPEPNAVKSNKCSVQDPQTGQTYDLLALSDFNYRTSDRNGSAFTINVCKPVLYGENTMCPPGSSVCFMSLKTTDFKQRFFDYGTAQANPVIENGKLLMRHTSMTQCNSTTNYTSVIYFYCDRNVRNAHPELLAYENCVYEFTFVTPLACNDLEPCTAVTRASGIIDLSPLQKNHPITLQKDSKNVSFGICSAAGTPCLEKDGACFSVNGQQTSLGTINSHLHYNQTGSPYLLYENGAPCQLSGGDSSLNTKPWSTKIEFICANNTKTPKADGGSDAAELGPKIVEMHNCEVLIHYQTNLACQDQIACKIKTYDDDGAGVGELDLTPLINTLDNYVAQVDDSLITAKKVGEKTKFYLNVCRPLVPKYGLGCPGGSAGCMANVDGPTPEDEQSLGFPMVSLAAINSTTAELRYFQGSECPTDKNSKLSMGIQFYCDQSAGRGTPILRTISDCHYEFIWASNVVCPPHECNFDADTCEISNQHINVKYNLKNAPFTDAGKIKLNKDNKEFSINVCGNYRKALTDYSQGLVNLYFAADGPCNKNGKINVQMRIICSGETKHEAHFTDDIQCNLLYEQRTPDVCKFLGLYVPKTTTPTTIAPAVTTVTTKTTAKPPATQAGLTSTQAPPSESQPATHTGNVGAILAAILSVTCFVSCLALFALSPQRRNAVRRLFRRSSSAVRYSRVQSNEEANLLLEPNGEFTDSDDDMLL